MNGALASLAPLGLVVAPALMKFAGAPASSDATVHEAVQLQCVTDPESPVHERFRGTGDVEDHLALGARVRVLAERKNWRQIAYVSEGVSETGWVTASHLGACSSVSTPPVAPVPSVQPTSAEHPHAPVAGGASCGGSPMTVKFYDVGQALSALVTLPDGRRILVDTGEQGTRAGCGAPCKVWSEHLLSALEQDVPDKKLAMLWITHQHSDHAGNAPAILREMKVGVYVDNGTNLDSGIIKKGHDAARERSTPNHVVDPDHQDIPLASAGDVKIAAVLPNRWPVDCEDAPNDCSIGLRVDYCRSSVLFTGDAEETEEAALKSGPVTLIQVGHHGSDTSSSDEFLGQAAPRFAVVSAAKRDEGTNKGFCHPRLSTIENLTKLLGGSRSQTIEAFDAAVSCKSAMAQDHWRKVSASDTIWVTARDGDVELVTTGDGAFHRQEP